MWSVSRRASRLLTLNPELEAPGTKLKLSARGNRALGWGGAERRGLAKHLNT